jgi:hypothetical protein
VSEYTVKEYRPNFVDGGDAFQEFRCATKEEILNAPFLQERIAKGQELTVSVKDGAVFLGTPPAPIVALIKGPGAPYVKDGRYCRDEGAE